MRDWSENIPSAESLTGYVAWHQTQKDYKDVFTAKRYAIALKESNLPIGVVGMAKMIVSTKWKWLISLTRHIGEKGMCPRV